ICTDEPLGLPAVPYHISENIKSPPMPWKSCRYPHPFWGRGADQPKEFNFASKRRSPRQLYHYSVVFSRSRAFFTRWTVLVLRPFSLAVRRIVSPLFSSPTISECFSTSSPSERLVPLARPLYLPSALARAIPSRCASLLLL